LAGVGVFCLKFSQFMSNLVMNYFRKLFEAASKEEPVEQPAVSRAELLQNEMLTLTLRRELPTRFEYKTSEGEHVAVWFDALGKQTDEFNHDNFDKFLDIGKFHLIQEKDDHDMQVLIKSMSQLFARDLGTCVKINDQWFDAEGAMVDAEDAARFETMLNELPLRKLTVD